MNLSTVNTYNVSEKYDHSILSQIDTDMNNPQLNDSFSTSTYYDENSFNYSFSNNKYLSLFHMNIRSTPKHFRDLKAYLSNLKHSFSIIRISETWLQDEVPSYTLVNYDLEIDYRGGFLISRSSAIRKFIAGFLKCDSRTIMKSFLKKSLAN